MFYNKKIHSETTRKSSATDMTSGSIPRLLLVYCLPLILGNLFQVLYNTVDAMVVGNFVGKEALAAVAAANPLVNIAVFTFNGISVGAGVVIGHHFGAHNPDRLHRSVETTMALTFLCSIVFTAAGICATPVLLKLMSTPEDVFDAAVLYLRIYFAGISGLLVYNMGSGILRAVGDSKRPLYFLILSTVTNIVLDLVLVVVIPLGIAGAAYATLVSQLLSAILVLILLTTTEDVYQFCWRDLRIDFPILRDILKVGLPSGFQSMITSLSNSFVMAYINTFGSSVMAGWGCYNKLDQILLLPIQSMGHASATFVSQNMGAGRDDRANQGTKTAVLMIVGINAALGALLFLLARPAINIFTSDPSVIESGVEFTRSIALFFWINGINHTLAGSMRGRGNSTAPMIIMLATFVGARQIYLYVLTRFVRNPVLIGVGYPVGWVLCCVTELIYYKCRYLSGRQDNSYCSRPESRKQ